MRFYLWLNESKQGPFTPEVIEEMRRNGLANALTLCCPEFGDEQDWQPLRDVRATIPIKPPVVIPEVLPPAKSVSIPIAMNELRRHVGPPDFRPMIVLGIIVAIFYTIHLLNPNYEYKTIFAMDADVDSTMQKLGSEGWELVTQRRAKEGYSLWGSEMTFKRRK